jgi:hypothetical protein
MPSKEIKKEAIHSILEQSPLDARHYPGLQKISKFPQRNIILRAILPTPAKDDMVHHFDF